MYDGPMDADRAGPADRHGRGAGAGRRAGRAPAHRRRRAAVGDWLDERYAALPGRTHAWPSASRSTSSGRGSSCCRWSRRTRGSSAAGRSSTTATRWRWPPGSRRATRRSGEIERARFPVVLLDEYQDTSHAQLVLLRALFGGGHPVTAVGDPCQSIYGWRGACGGNLRRFAQPTSGPRAGGPAPVGRFQRQLPQRRAGSSTSPPVSSCRCAMEAREVPVLVPGADRVDRGRVTCALHETAEDEAEWIAAQIAELLGLPRSRPTACPGARRNASRRSPYSPRTGDPGRKRSQFPALRRALEERGIPVEVVGLGGLLTVPEVADIVATLRVLYDPTAGDALARLLAGPRWRIGPRDLVALGNRPVLWPATRPDRRPVPGPAPPIP